VKQEMSKSGILHKKKARDARPYNAAEKETTPIRLIA